MEAPEPPPEQSPISPDEEEDAWVPFKARTRFRPVTADRPVQPEPPPDAAGRDER
jgi:hypothetical protein